MLILITVIDPIDTAVFSFIMLQLMINKTIALIISFLRRKVHNGKAGKESTT